MSSSSSEKEEVTATTTTTTTVAEAEAEATNDNTMQIDNDDNPTTTVTLIAKYNKDKIILEGLSPTLTILHVKKLLESRTNILCKRQKLVGLVALQGGVVVTDDLPLSQLKVKGKAAAATAATTTTHSFILMGTPEANIFVDPADRNIDDTVIDDFDLDFNAGSEEWLQHCANAENLKQFTRKTQVYIMNPPRTNPNGQPKPLLVLDLDHTLLDFSSRQILNATTTSSLPDNNNDDDRVVAAMKRPYMNEFLTTCYKHFDMVVWSQTSWRWLETKLIELGMLTHPGYKFVFVLDKTSMFTVVSTKKRDGTTVTHHVKPLEIIWSKFPHWNVTNTCHVDDLSRNFALNLKSGLKIKPYHRKKSSAKRDVELLGLSRYLEQLATKANAQFDQVDFQKWPEVVSGKRKLLTSETAAAAQDKDEKPRAK